ncbi:DUF3581 family protein [Moritella sp. Urea-trap-13]|uniref:DUF3581 family protein n=1 Tax=Moritella sp. Urea-trap-13 TaxID=2058327 RepID=UPI000C31F95E|nr:DUF3581 family protein [Moritella sp. Urea-trap-13]PKH09594.1 DUF3581 domain-containing protein [Moritella sp. Urea-trap-13]
MFLNEFYSQKDSSFRFTQQQASRFAKTVANDYNKIHDVDNKRFCVPGDLLFAVSLAKFGLSETMKIDFTGMVKNDTDLVFSPLLDNKTEILNPEQKSFMELELGGQSSHDESIISKIIKEYVQFSGKNFPDIMVPLMRSKNLMFNPARALIMYKSMQISMTRVQVNSIELKFDEAIIEVQGKRATVTFKFDFYEGDDKVGTGQKIMLLSGLIAYEEAVMAGVIADYQSAKTKYLAAAS